MRWTHTTSLKLLVYLIAFGHLAWLVSGVFLGHLGANPVETLTHETGNWALVFLLLTLAATPARRWLNWSAAIRLRRFLGLWSFFYLVLHFAIFIVFDHFFDLVAIWADVIDRPYITVGFLAFVLMLPLAITSTKGMMKRLGKHWGKLHKLVYLIAFFGVLHFWWLVKADILEPLLYGLVLVALLLPRVYWYVQKRRR